MEFQKLIKYFFKLNKTSRAFFAVSNLQSEDSQSEGSNDVLHYSRTFHNERFPDRDFDEMRLEFETRIAEARGEVVPRFNRLLPLDMSDLGRNSLPDGLDIISFVEGNFNNWQYMDIAAIRAAYQAGDEAGLEAARQADQRAAYQAADLAALQAAQQIASRAAREAAYRAGSDPFDIEQAAFAVVRQAHDQSLNRAINRTTELAALEAARKAYIAANHLAVQDAHQAVYRVGHQDALEVARQADNAYNQSVNQAGFEASGSSCPSSSCPSSYPS